MAITQVGSSLTVNPGGTHANSGQVPTLTVPASIVVPTGTELVVICVSGGTASANGYESLWFQKNGVATPCVRGNGGDVSNTIWQAGMFWQVLPDIVSNQVITWDWAGSANSPSGAMMFSMTFWKGIDTDDPVRSSVGMQGRGAPYTTPTLTAQSGDKIVAFFGGFNNGVEGDVTGWSNATGISNETTIGYADGAWAGADPTGNQTVGITSITQMSEGGLVACVLKPSGGTQYRLLTNLATITAGNAQPEPVRNVATEVSGNQMMVLPQLDQSIDTAVIKGRVAQFGWGVS